MVVGLQHLLVCCVISSTLNWSQTLTTWKAIHLLLALSYRRDKTWNGWPECTILTPMSVKKWHNNSFAEKHSKNQIKFSLWFLNYPFSILVFEK